MYAVNVLYKQDIYLIYFIQVSKGGFNMTLQVVFQVLSIVFPAVLEIIKLFL